MRWLWPNKPIRFYDLTELVSSIGDGWVVQPKWDGHRALVKIEDGHVTIFSRHKRPLRMAHVGGWAWLGMVFGDNLLIDGEMVSPHEIVVWDFINEETFVKSSTYNERLVKLQSLLSSSISKGDETVKIVETRPASRYKELLLRRRENIEGLVFKNLRAKNFFDSKSTKEVSSQLKYLFK